MFKIGHQQFILFLLIIICYLIIIYDLLILSIDYVVFSQNIYSDKWFVSCTHTKQDDAVFLAIALKQQLFVNGCDNSFYQFKIISDELIFRNLHSESTLQL